MWPHFWALVDPNRRARLATAARRCFCWFRVWLCTSRGAVCGHHCAVDTHSSSPHREGRSTGKRAGMASQWPAVPATHRPATACPLTADAKHNPPHITQAAVHNVTTCLQGLWQSPGVTGPLVTHQLHFSRCPEKYGSAHNCGDGNLCW